MNAKELMTTDVKTCAPSDPLNRAAQLMWDHDCGCVPVVDEQRVVVGMITDRDVCMAAYTQGRPMSEIPVSDAMSRHVYGCTPETTVEAAEALMQRHQVRRLPVLDAKQTLQGLLSLNDLARASIDTSSGKSGVSAVGVDRTLAEVCQPRCPVEMTANG